MKKKPSRLRLVPSLETARGHKRKKPLQGGILPGNNLTLPLAVTTGVALADLTESDLYPQGQLADLTEVRSLSPSQASAGLTIVVSLSHLRSGFSRTDHRAWKATGYLNENYEERFSSFLSSDDYFLEEKGKLKDRTVLW